MSELEAMLDKTIYNVLNISHAKKMVQPISSVNDTFRIIKIGYTIDLTLCDELKTVSQ